MDSLEIIEAGIFTTVQDKGRLGYAYYAVPRSGFMDDHSAQKALSILDLPSDYPLLECTSKGPIIQFRSSSQIAITGADMNWKLNGEAIKIGRKVNVNADDILKSGFSRSGFRAYIAIDGKLSAQNIYNSYSTYTNAKIGGFNGRALRKGDVIEWNEADKTRKRIEPKNTYKGLDFIPIKKGPEFTLLTPPSRAFLTQCIYTIDPDSNRMGARLKGTKLLSRSYQLKNSRPILPGFIQLPPSQLPIVILQDGQTTGGYPRIAYIQEKYLASFNQIAIGKEVQLRLVD